jgi:MFS family permease
MGALLSALLWAYAFSQLPVGGLIDRFGPRKLLAWGLALWSGAQLLCGFVTGMTQCFAARLLLGIGEAPQFPSAGRVVRDWFAVRHRGLATGIFNGSSTLGTGLAAPVPTALMLMFGWRWMFIIMGLLGLLAGALWYLLYREPSQVALTARKIATDRVVGTDRAASGRVQPPLRYPRRRAAWRFPLAAGHDAEYGRDDPRLTSESARCDGARLPLAVILPTRTAPGSATNDRPLIWTGMHRQSCWTRAPTARETPLPA